MFTNHTFAVKSVAELDPSESETLPKLLVPSFNNQRLYKLNVQLTSGTNAVVFLLDKEPMLFQIGNVSKTEFFPTVYFLWSHPTIFPTLNILHSTFGFLQKGADLMLPGIELINQFPIFEENSIVAISTINQNKEVGGEGISTICGPMAVGRALFSSEEMKQKRETGQKGKAVEILHIFGDYLWELGSKRSFPQFTDRCPTQQRSPDVELTDNLYMSLWNFMGKSVQNDISTNKEDISSTLKVRADNSLKNEQQTVSNIRTGQSGDTSYFFKRVHDFNCNCSVCLNVEQQTYYDLNLSGSKGSDNQKFKQYTYVNKNKENVDQKSSQLERCSNFGSIEEMSPKQKVEKYLKSCGGSNNKPISLTEKHKENEVVYVKNIQHFHTYNNYNYYNNKETNKNFNSSFQSSISSINFKNDNNNSKSYNLKLMNELELMKKEIEKLKMRLDKQGPSTSDNNKEMRIEINSMYRCCSQLRSNGAPASILKKQNYSKNLRVTWAI